MRTVTLFENEKQKIIAFYVDGELMYTKTYIMDSSGFVENYVTVWHHGDISINGKEVKKHAETVCE